MAQENSQFAQKLGLLSEEAQFYFSHDFCGDLIIALANEYKLNPDLVYDLVFEVVKNDFNLVSLRQKVTSLGLVGLVQDSFFQDFIGKILLPVSPYLKTVDLRGELIKAGGKVEKYQAIVNNFQEIIEDENFKEVDKFLELYDDIDLQEEHRYVLDILENNLKEALFNSGLKATTTLNAGLIYLLNNDKNFKFEAVRTVLENNETLTAGTIILEDKAVSGTISNWLKDFIKINGSELFNELTLAEYLSSSANTKKLTAKEKDLLRKLLKFYRHLSFFPESFSDTPVTSWHIIPLDTQEEEILSARKLVDVLSDEPVKKALPEEAPLVSSTTLSPEKELEEILKQYAVGSFEYKAITQEIERLKKKK